jgi:Flp pilus assembly protein TadG
MRRLCSGIIEARQQRPTLLRRRPGRLRARRGAALVEFALTSSILFLLLFVAIEFMRVNTIINSAENAVYEGARVGVVPGATPDKIIAKTEAVISAIGVRGASVSVEPAAIDNDTPQVTVSIDVPITSNTILAPRFFLGDTLSKTCTLTRERNRQ